DPAGGPRRAPAGPDRGRVRRRAHALAGAADRAAAAGGADDAAEPRRPARRAAQGLLAGLHRELPGAAEVDPEQRAVLRQPVLRGALRRGRGDVPRGQPHAVVVRALAEPAHRCQDGSPRGAGARRRGRRGRRAAHGSADRTLTPLTPGGAARGQPAVAEARSSRTTVTVISPG